MSQNDSQSVAATEQAGNGTQRTALLEVSDLRKWFPIQRGFFSRTVGQVKAVDGVSFYVRPGETLGLVGESGCGKTTTGRLIMHAFPPTAGDIWFDDQELGQVNIATLEKQQLKRLRRNMQMVFQDPYSSLNPRMNLLQNVGEPLLVNDIAKGQELEDRVAELLRVVGLRPEYLNRYPHAFSGGQRQRIGVARALALNPQLIVLDEPVSALDVSVQAQILNLLQDLQQEFDLTYLFIAHDLSVVEHISDRVAVMYVGMLVESARTEVLYRDPQHPYTEALLSSVPKPDPRDRAEPIVLEGDVADPVNPMVMPTAEMNGNYGGSFRRGFKGVSDRWGPTKMQDRGLSWYDQNLNMQPRMAESWELNDDASEWTFHLREGMKWSDGTPFTTEAIRWWWENDETNSTITPSIGGTWVTGSERTPMEVEIVDDSTVNFKFDVPNPLFVYRLGRQTTNLYLPGHYMEQFHMELTDDQDTLQAQVDEAGFNSWEEFYIDRRWWYLAPDLPSIGPWISKNELSNDSS